MRFAANVEWRTVLTIALTHVLGGGAVLAFGTLELAHAQAPGTEYATPGKSQAEQRMLRRLVEIAEGPPPTMEALAAEFGFVYQKAPNHNERLQGYYATGSFPFEPGLAANYLYMPEATLPAILDMPARSLPESVNISFKFITKAGEVSPFCVPRDELKVLLKASWSFHAETVPPHNYELEGYGKTSDGYSRGAGMSPLWASCITSFSVTYEKGRCTSPL